jgi:hypothetical protein
MIGTTDSEVEARATPLVKRSIPWVFSISVMSTVTPVTIRMTLHGIRWMAFCSSTARSSVSAAAMKSAVIPTCAPTATTRVIQMTMPAMVSQCLASIGSASDSIGAAMPSRLRKSRSPPSTTKPPKPTMACASTL